MRRLSARPELWGPLVGGLLLIALIIDAAVLEPTDAGAVVWVLVNSPPTILAALIARSAGVSAPRSVALAVFVAIVTWLGILLMV